MTAKRNKPRRIRDLWRTNSSTGRRFPKAYAISGPKGFTFNARALLTNIKTHPFKNNTYADWPLPHGGRMTGMQRQAIARRALSTQLRAAEELQDVAHQALHGSGRDKTQAIEHLREMGYMALEIDSRFRGIEALAIMRTASVKTLRKMIGELWDLPLRSFTVMHANMVLEDGQRLQQYNIKTGSRIGIEVTQFLDQMNANSQHWYNRKAHREHEELRRKLNNIHARAATKIQAAVRGRQARKRYLALLEPYYAPGGPGAKAVIDRLVAAAGQQR
jgi:hypothetical protein